ncbi:DUF6094 domain-containing protein [Vibrio mediterranei]|uniref:DUF6094 domain-containing protein n=1 Tax=Vibrio mediterranei TaxID=689 RepID=UPI0038CDF9D8
MAIMHPRIAHNYLKDGYYPTDEPTLTLIASRLSFKAGVQRLLDPCCGQGEALRFLATHINGQKQSQLHTYGVELDQDRAARASSQLDTVLRSNAFDTMIGQGSQSLLFLNPPYGDVVTDHVDKQQREMARLEIQFTQRMLPTLKRDGVMVLVLPFPSLTPAFCRYLARRLRDVQVFDAATDRFKQVVILGRKADMRGQQYQTERSHTAQGLMQVGEGQPYASYGVAAFAGAPQTLTIPSVNEGAFRFELVRPDSEQLSLAFASHGGLWPTFETQFNQARHQPVPRPLRKLSPWHLSLSLAAGQIAGKVVSNDGSRTLLVKGGTQKVQRAITTVDEHHTITTTVDQFQPLIRAIDLTPGEGFGQIIVIQ